jgi:aerobic-type carbon monoxide dehydrogenase small subunit (CoxS/CutS family)
MDSDFHDITLSVNGKQYQRRVESRLLLSDFIRHDLALAGTHVGCEHGVCGACTVLLDGQPVRSCLMLAVQARDHEISTVEGLTMTAFLDENPSPTENDVREALSGNLCRCTGYQNIVDAVMTAAMRTRGR